MNGIVKLSLAAVTVLSFLLSATPVIADEGEYRPEFGTLAEHNQWATKAIGIDKVAALGFEGEGVKVAVLDSGISMSTPGISNKVVAYKDFLPSQQPLPDHGTQAIGTISNDFDAATGIRGVAPKASIIVARVCYMSSCDSTAISQGFAWAIEQGAQVISMSFGGGPGSMQNPQILAAVKAGVLVVAAAGNSACKPVEYWGVNRNCLQGVISEGYPASYTIPGLISAGASDQSGGRASFSSWGPNLDLLAPGVNNVTYDPIGLTNGFGGTSAATPMIAGVAALVLGINPRLTPVEVQGILQSSAKPAKPLKPKVWDDCTKSEATNSWSCKNQVDNEFPQEYFTGAGIVDAMAAVKLTQQFTSGELLAKPLLDVVDTQVTISWAGARADIYSNNKLLATSKSSGFVISGNYGQSFSLQIKQGGKFSKPNLVIIKNPIIPPLLEVIEATARLNVIYITTKHDASQVTQNVNWWGGSIFHAIFEFDSGKEIACQGQYSPFPIDTPNKVFNFNCPTSNLQGQVNGKLKLINRFSQIGLGAPVIIPNVVPENKVLEVRTSYISSDSIVFDWDLVANAKSYAYRYDPDGQWFCTNDTEFSLVGKSTQPSVFAVAAKSEADCGGYSLIESDYLGYVLLSPRPAKPLGITVKNEWLTSVEFEVPGALAMDTWRVYRSDGLLVRFYSPGQRLWVGVQPNEDVNGRVFTYRFVKVVLDTWGEVWSEPSDPIAASFSKLASPSAADCQLGMRSSTISCTIKSNSQVESTLIEYLDSDGEVLDSSELSNNSSGNLKIAGNISSAAVSIRVSGVAGRINEWMRRGDSLTTQISKRTTKSLKQVAY